MLRLNVIVCVIVTVVSLLVFFLSLFDYFGAITRALVEFMCCGSIGFLVLTILCGLGDSAVIQTDDGTVHPAGIYTVMAFVYAIFAAMFAWASFAAMAAL